MWVIGCIIAMFIVNWLIVMGSDPKEWKGGKKDEYNKGKVRGKVHGDRERKTKV